MAKKGVYLLFLTFLSSLGNTTNLEKSLIIMSLLNLKVFLVKGRSCIQGYGLNTIINVSLQKEVMYKFEIINRS